MPILPFIPLIGAGIQAAANIFSNNANNNRQVDIMNQQRAWAVEDWNKQNAYNAPAAQMQRFKDAGLNPNLIYGQSNTAAPVRSTESAKTQPNRYDGVVETMLQGFMSMYNLQKIQAEKDKIEKQTELMEAERRLKEQMTTGQKYKNYVSGSTLDTQVSFMEGRNKLLGAEIGKKLVDTEYTINQNERQNLLTANTLYQGVINALNSESQRATNHMQRMYLQAQIDNLKKDGTLKQLDINLKQKGIQPGDPAYMRIGAQILTDPAGAVEGVKKVVKSIGDMVSPDILRPLYAKPGAWQK